jgi:hypothetical protein
VQVGQSAEQRLKAPLAWSVGFVDLKVNAAGSTVVTPQGDNLPADARFELPPGDHEIQVVNECCATGSARVQVAAGTVSSTEVTLTAKPEFVEATVSSAREAARGGKIEGAQRLMESAGRLSSAYRDGLAVLADEAQKAGRAEEALSLATAVMRGAPDSPASNRVMAQALMFRGRWGEAIKPFWHAVSGQQTVVVPVLHHGYGFSGDRACPGLLKLGLEQFRFESRCQSKDQFEVAARGLKIDVFRGFPGAIRLKVPQARNKTRDFRFYPLSARLVNKGRSTVTDIVCDAGCLSDARALTVMIVSASEGKLRDDLDMSRVWQ